MIIMIWENHDNHDDQLHDCQIIIVIIVILHGDDQSFKITQNWSMIQHLFQESS